jgi:hypothetical protein
MKSLLAGAIFAACCACSSLTGKDQLSGTYTKAYSGQYGTVYDTVQVQALSGDNMYHVTIRRRIEKVYDKKKWPTEYKVEAPVLAKYDADSKVLEIDGFPVYAVDLNGPTLTKGNVTYDKAK